MHTSKQKEEERITKVHLINIVSTVNLMAFLVNSLHKVYKNYTVCLIRMLCCAVYLESEQGYFYRNDLYKMLPYKASYFKNVFNRFVSDYFIVLEQQYQNRTKYKLSKLSTTTLQEFYSIFIQQLSNSI